MEGLPSPPAGFRYDARRHAPGRSVTEPAASHRGYGYFVLGVATWFAAWGAQSVLFAWLVVGVLEADASRVGTAQMSGMLPSLLFLLVGGAFADRVDVRRMLPWLYALAFLLSALLLAAVLAGRLSYPLLIVYALAIGTVSAFVMPARDALLSDVAGSDMMRAVAGLTLAQWGSQAVGNLAGSSARWIGTPAALAIPAFFFLAGAPLLLKVPRPATSASSAGRPPSRGTLHEIGEGLRIVAGSPVLRPIVYLVVAVGVLFIGPFMVVIPLLVRDVYGGGVGELGVLSMMFPMGTIVGSLLLLWRGGIRRKGLAQLLALAGGAAALGTVALGLALPVTLLAITFWGVAASVFMSAGRTLFQEAAPPTHRGRVLSVYSLGFMGSGPLGALLSGLLVERFGPLTACGASAVAMLVVVLGVGATSGVARLE